MSVEYYTRFERGNAQGVSDSVLEGVALALQLDDAERAHLYDLVRVANAANRTRRRPPQRRVRPGVQQLLDAMPDVPAFVQSGRLDILATNRLGRALYSQVYDQAAGVGRAGRLPNHARFTFLDPGAPDFYPDWGRAAADTVALLRAEAGRNPTDSGLTDLVGELTTRSETFSSLWATPQRPLAHDGHKALSPPRRRRAGLAYEGLELAGDPGQTLITFTAEADSPSRHALQFLANWADVSEQTEADPLATEQRTN